MNIKQAVNDCIKVYEKHKERLRWYIWKNFPDITPEEEHEAIMYLCQWMTNHVDKLNSITFEQQYHWLSQVCHRRIVFQRRKEWLESTKRTWKEKFQNLRKRA